MYAFMKKNVLTMERALCVAIGLVGSGLSLAFLDDWWRWVGILVFLGLLLTGVGGSCPLRSAVNRRTDMEL
jgi:fatty acid desaturase